MIFTRRFGALAARRPLVAVTEQQNAELHTPFDEQGTDQSYVETSSAA